MFMVFNVHWATQRNQTARRTRNAKVSNQIRGVFDVKPLEVFTRAEVFTQWYDYCNSLGQCYFSYERRYQR